MAELQLTGLAPRAALRAVREALEQADVPDAAFDARELDRLAVGKDPRLDTSPLTAAEAAALAALTDAGDIESFQGTWLDGAADKLEGK